MSEGPETPSDASAVLVDTVLAFDSLPRAVVVTDLAGTILSWNAVATDLYGWDRSEVLGRPVQEVIVVAAQARDEVTSVREVVSGGATWTGEFEVRRRDGSMTRTWSFVGPLRDGAGNIVGVVSVASNLLPAEISALVQTAEKGDRAGAEKLHRRLLPLLKDIFIEPNPVPIKTALAWRGMMSGECRLPLCEMTEANQTRLRKTIEAFEQSR